MNNPIFRWYRSALRHPQYRWWIILGTAAYLFSPIDISPDLVPLLGQVDDAAIVVLLISELYQIFTEWVEARREIAAPSNNVSDTATPESQTVDVDAVSID
ncbi:MAG: YkvA family protein [Geitlerinemataceae cyanobacterium]